MERMRARWIISGQQKWDESYKGVDMFTGAYSASVTDLDFQGGFGIPVSVQRSYNSENADEGPFGIGWSLSADVRTTAGGVLKSSKAPVMATPTTFKEMPAGQTDPRLATPPSAGVVVTDASANEETIQKDVDGILTTPPWDNNVSNPTYAYVTSGGTAYQVQTSNQTTTIDGTVYQYSNKGQYTYGEGAYSNPASSSNVCAPSYILKPTSVTDRQGNPTYYNYSSTTATFQKANGPVTENELTSVQMPNGHTLTFTWNQNVNGSGLQRITSVTDGTRTVNYGYDSNGYLTSVTTPGGKETLYGYAQCSYSNMPLGYTFPNQEQLVSITDPRGLETQFQYWLDTITLEPYGVTTEGVLLKNIIAPNGSETALAYYGEQVSNSTPQGTLTAAYEFPNQNQDFSQCSQVVSFTGGPVSQGYQTAESVQAPRTSTQEYEFKWADTLQNYNTFDTYLGEQVVKTYDPFMESMLECYTLNYRNYRQGERTTDEMTDWQDYAVLDQNFTYNFMGNPLSEKDEQYVSASPPGNANGNYPDVFQYKAYAYWDQTKYFQQKAVVDRLDYSNGLADLGSWPHGRISYTDYYTSTAALGSRGQTYKTYSDPYVPSWNNAPVSSGTQIDWQDNLSPSTTSGDPYSSETAYDSAGRATDVYKLAPSTVIGTFPYSYVHTSTVYNDGAGWYGEPETVTEDVGGIGRVTQTLGYDSSGHATQTEDAAGHIFNTDFVGQASGDHQVQDIVETDCTPNKTLVSYTYGTQAGVVNYGQVDSVTDGLSGVSDSFTYDPNSSDPGYGQVSETTESWPWDAGGSQHGYSVNYTYTPDGDRGTTTYLTDNGTTEWQYDSYASLGLPQNGGECSRAPQTMRQIVSNSPTAEEFHYQYDGGGRMMAATFAMTPASGYTPSSGQPWYTAAELPSTRARAVYDNTGGGQLLNLDYFWDSWGGSAYNSNDIYSYAYSYDPNTWLKTDATLDDFNPHSEVYGYDSMLDYLTSANYGNGAETWTYDPAGNRSSDSGNTGAWAYDNLNRMSASPQGSYSNDILGNRDSDPSGAAYGWDQLNRLTSYAKSSTTTSYGYRADGMRVQKSTSSAGTTFAYDGQMGFEDTDSGSSPAVTDYAIGPRGIDRLAKTVSGTTTTVYPIFDGHGNMVATLGESGASYTTGDDRQYDAWGSILTSDGSGDPKGRYCANLGHKQDDESGLIYMRARYEDPRTGRFLSQDPSREGPNWFVYADSSPACHEDKTGKDTLVDVEVGMSMADYIEGLAEELEVYCEDVVEDLESAKDGRPPTGFFRDFLSEIGRDPDQWRYAAIRIGNEQGLSGTIKILYMDQFEEEALIECIWSDAGDLASDHSLPYLEGTM